MNYKELLISKDKSLLDALKQLDKTAKKILFVIDEKDRLVGSLTDGDVRRFILRNGSLEGKVEDICNKDTFKVKIGFDKKRVVKEAISQNIKFIPVVSEKEEIVELIYIGDTFDSPKVYSFIQLDIPVVIMAGGFGTRLEPFTKILPKPLIPIGDKTILEIIMDKFYQYGINEFWISVNYKANIIKSYIAELELPYSINYIQEEKPLGTAGSLYLLKDKIKKDNFILTNCDIILDIDYIDLFQFHQENKNDITIITSAQEFKIPYGVCEVSDGELIYIKEKPELRYLVNTGMYVIKTELLELIPNNQFFHATDLIKKAKDNKRKIGIYPISGDSWIDIGQWDEYKKTLERIKIW